MLALLNIGWIHIPITFIIEYMTVIGYPGTGKSSLSIVFYKKLWKN